MPANGNPILPILQPGQAPIDVAIGAIDEAGGSVDLLWKISPTSSRMASMPADSPGSATDIPSRPPRSSAGNWRRISAFRRRGVPRSVRRRTNAVRAEAERIAEISAVTTTPGVRTDHQNTGPGFSSAPTDHRADRHARRAPPSMPSRWRRRRRFLARVTQGHRFSWPSSRSCAKAASLKALGPSPGTARPPPRAGLRWGGPVPAHGTAAPPAADRTRRFRIDRRLTVH